MYFCILTQTIRLNKEELPSILLVAQVEYAELAGKTGFYLGMLDLVLLGIERQKDVAFMFYNNSFSDTPEIKWARDILAEFVPTALIWDRAEPSLASKETWLFVSCKANFKPGEERQLNHWMPAFHRDLCGSEWFEMKTSTILEKTRKRLEKARRRAADASSDDEWHESLVEHMELLGDKLAFLETLHRAGVFVHEVPAAGDCAVWSAMAVADGYMLLGEPSSKADMRNQRKETRVIMVHHGSSKFMHIVEKHHAKPFCSADIKV